MTKQMENKIKTLNPLPGWKQWHAA